LSLEQNSSDFNSQKESIMTQAVKKVEATEVVSSKVPSTVDSQKSNSVKVQEATVLQLDRSKNLSRFLEASCDCF